MLVLQGVSKSYDDGQTDAVQEIDLEGREGELLVPLGESGCGDFRAIPGTPCLHADLGPPGKYLGFSSSNKFRYNEDHKPHPVAVAILLELREPREEDAVSYSGRLNG